jgi:1-phosphatidylinositol-3-phosphate 5-kinase
MAKSLESPTKLTEFGNPPLHPESPQNVGIRSTFARWFGIKTSSPPQSAIGTIKEGLVVSDCSPDEATAISQSIDDFSSISSSSTATYTEGRNLVSVLTRVSNLLAQKGVYNDEEFKRYWMPDSVSKECYECRYTNGLV